VAEEEEVSVTSAEGKVALDLHIGALVRVVLAGNFGLLHSEGMLRPRDEPSSSGDHACYELVTAANDRFPFTLARNATAVCTVTDSALIIQYEQAMIRVVWARGVGRGVIAAD